MEGDHREKQDGGVDGWMIGRERIGSDSRERPATPAQENHWDRHGCQGNMRGWSCLMVTK